MKLPGLRLMTLGAVVAVVGFLQVTSALEKDLPVKGPAKHASIEAYPTAVISLKDKASGSLFYVESNGRQLVAFDSDGTIAWSIDVFDAAKINPARGTPVIRDLRIVDGALSVTCARSHFVIVDLKTGDAKFAGND